MKGFFPCIIGATSSHTNPPDTDEPESKKITKQNSARVDFIVGGVQKGGTTALFHYISHHPHILPPATQKELHFFDNEAIDWESPDYSKYHRNFSDAAGLRFEATPIYIYWPPSLERIRRYRSDIKLAFIFRDPIERAWSHWCMEYARKWESLDFRSAIRSEPQLVAGLSPTDDVRRIRSYVDRGFYGRQVKKLLKLFPREQVLFLSQHELKRSPKVTLTKVADFLAIAPFPDMAPIVSNPRESIDYPSQLEATDIDFLRDLYYEDLQEFSKLTNIDVANWLTMR